MRELKTVGAVLAACLAVPLTTALAHGKGSTHSSQTRSAAMASLCVAGSSTASFTDKFGSGTVAFRSRGACTSFVSKDRTLSAFKVTPTATFAPQSVFPSSTTSLKLAGNSTAARAVCPTTHNATVAFSNNSVMVNGNPVKVMGQTLSLNQLAQSSTTTMTGTHTFTNHGGCVSFFAKNKHMFVFTLKTA
jgi:uncharacterized Zn-binding protein involved in type VI secretion